MVNYNEAKARAWEHFEGGERITKAIITWVDSEYEYDLEIENEDRWSDDGFEDWVRENAEELAKEDAEKNKTTFEEIDSVRFETEDIDFEETFDRDYEIAVEFEWECLNGR